LLGFIKVLFDINTLFLRAAQENERIFIFCAENNNFISFKELLLDMVWVKRILIGIIIFYFALAILSVILYGWQGIAHFFISPFNMVLGFIEGLIRGFEKAPEAFQKGREATG